MKNKCKFVKTKLFSDRQFYHKWALLTDPDDITGGAKVGGFIEHCCTCTLKFKYEYMLQITDNLRII